MKMANTRIKRDLDDRLADRAQEVIERATTAAPMTLHVVNALMRLETSGQIVHCPRFRWAQSPECTCVGYQQPILTTVSTNVWHWVMSQLKLVN